jgi:hypothetical protein
MTREELFAAIVTNEMGIIPNVTGSEFKAMVDSLSEEDFRKISRRYRKGVRKAAKFFFVKKFLSKRAKRRAVFEYIDYIAKTAARDDPTWRSYWPANELGSKDESGGVKE